MVTIKNYKFQAMVKPLANRHGAPVESDAVPRRVVVRSETSADHGSQMFSALVSGESNLGPYTIVVLRLAGDDVCDYLAVGDHFRLWLGDDFAEGVITRRLFVLSHQAGPRLAGVQSFVRGHGLTRGEPGEHRQQRGKTRIGAADRHLDPVQLPSFGQGEPHETPPAGGTYIVLRYRLPSGPPVNHADTPILANSRPAPTMVTIIFMPPSGRRTVDRCVFSSRVRGSPA